jgi:hypothetical protein
MPFKSNNDSQRSRRTHRAILPTSLSTFHLLTRLLLYSIEARSLAVTMPSLSEAFAFHIRTLPSSEPDKTKRASVVNNVEVTLWDASVQLCVFHQVENVKLPLHSFRVIYFWAMSLTRLPYSHCSIPTSRDELCPCR